MYAVDSGGGGAVAPDKQQAAGPRRLRIEPSAIPAALRAFETAHERVSRKVEELRGLEFREWATDPVSRKTAHYFNQRTHGGADSAIVCLLGYQRELERAADSLRQAKASYEAMEGSNAALWGKY